MIHDLVKHWTPPDCAPLGIDRRSCSTCQVGSLSNKNYLWASNKPRLSASPTNFVWKLNSRVAFSALVLLFQRSLKLFHLFSKLFQLLSYTNHSRIKQSVVPLNHDGTSARSGGLLSKCPSWWEKLRFWKEGKGWNPHCVGGSNGSLKTRLCHRPTHFRLYNCNGNFK